MNVAVSAYNSWQLLKIEGRVDSFNYSLVTQKIVEMVGRDVRFIAVDLNSTEFLNLPTLRFMSSTAELLSARGGELAIISPSDAMMRHLEIFAAPHQIRIYKSLPDLDHVAAPMIPNGIDHEAI